MHRLIFAVFAALAFTGKTPAPAQPDGTRAVTGKGWCSYPVPYPGECMKSCRIWKDIKEHWLIDLEDRSSAYLLNDSAASNITKDMEKSR